MDQRTQNEGSQPNLTVKVESADGFDEFVSKERGDDIEHGWTLMDMFEGAPRMVLGAWSVFGDREQAQEEIDRLNKLGEEERDQVGLSGVAVLAYYEFEPSGE